MGGTINNSVALCNYSTDNDLHRYMVYQTTKRNVLPEVAEEGSRVESLLKPHIAELYKLLLGFHIYEGIMPYS